MPNSVHFVPYNKMEINQYLFFIILNLDLLKIKPRSGFPKPKSDWFQNLLNLILEKSYAEKKTKKGHVVL